MAIQILNFKYLEFKNIEFSIFGNTNLEFSIFGKPNLKFPILEFSIFDKAAKS